jgi:hypothetical protein
MGSSEPVTLSSREELGQLKGPLTLSTAFTLKNTIPIPQRFQSPSVEFQLPTLGQVAASALQFCNCHIEFL